MANPQTEQGYTPIANELLTRICSTKFNATQYKIILLVMRYTYGFSRKAHGLSESFISRAISVSKRYVSNELHTLVNRNVITVYQESTYSSPRKLGINKNYDLWDTSNIQVESKSTTDEDYINTTVDEKFDTTDEQLLIQDNKNLNKKFKQNISPPRVFTDDSQEIMLALYLGDKIKQNNPKAKEPRIQLWAKVFNDLIKLDKREVEEVKKIIDFSQSDDFWKCNILSPTALRKQYDRLYLLIQTKYPSKIVGTSQFDRYINDEVVL